MRNLFKRKKKTNISCPEVDVVPSAKPGREYVCFPDGLRIIVEDGKYIGFYTQHPNKEG